MENSRTTIKENCSSRRIQLDKTSNPIQFLFLPISYESNEPLAFYISNAKGKCMVICTYLLARFHTTNFSLRHLPFLCGHRAAYLRVLFYVYIYRQRILFADE
jgi:hypothetical protein